MITGKLYNIIYADPPWKYGGGKGKNSSKWGNSLSSYDCMKLSEIKKIPVQSISSDNCALFMWVTLPMLQEGLELMDAWGFKYKTTAFVWNKTYRSGKPYCGMGYWTRSGAEICLLGFKGKLNRQSKTVYQIITAPVKEHSRKPYEVRKRIVELMGDLPRIELFARVKKENTLFEEDENLDGWDLFGNEAQNSIQLPP